MELVRGMRRAYEQDLLLRLLRDCFCRSWTEAHPLFADHALNSIETNTMLSKLLKLDVENTGLSSPVFPTSGLVLSIVIGCQREAPFQ